MLCICYSVISRYFFRSPSMYATEICVYLLLLGTWSSVGYVHKVDRHVRVEVFENLFGEGPKAIAKLISTICIIVFCAVLVWAGYLVAETAYLRNYRSTSLLKFPLWVTYALIPYGGFLLGCAALNRLVTGDKRLADDKNEDA
ncbi:TRAP transporter small permease [Allopusillimonas ginsengisoli]|uniref:TRAP transporter small permease n=1 Tax=Allopusillimonas ginsengisoli TaxID=453575 RepID=UPI0039C362E7